MSKFWVIFKREYIQVVKKKSFIIGIILTPALMAAFTILPAFFVRAESSSTEHLAVIDQTGQKIGNQFSESLSEYTLEDSDQPYYNVDDVFEVSAGDEETFRALNDSLSGLIHDKKLKYFLVLKPDAHLMDTSLWLVTNSDNFITFSRFERHLSNIMSSIRLGTTDVNLGVDSLLALTRPVDLKTRDAKGESIPFQIKYFTAIIFVGIMFGMMIGYGQIVMRSVIEEKNSRVMEVLISSVSPFQLMLGKVLGLGAATLTQVGVWYIMGAGIYAMKGVLDIDPAIDRILFNPAIIIFFILFMVSGYILYSTLFALIGSIVNSEKEAQSFIMPITMLMILPFILALHVVQEPNSALSVTLSLIPFLTPTMMMMRLVFVAPTLTDYSLFGSIIGEATLGLVLVILTMLAIVWLTSRIFRVGILMYGKRPTLPEIVKWVKY